MPCQWLSRITPVLTLPNVVTSQCASRNAAVLAMVVIPVQCPYRRLPCVSRRSSQFNIRTVASLAPSTITHARLDKRGGVV